MSKSKLALRVVGIILIAVCGYAGGVLSTWHPSKKAVSRAKNTRPDAWNHTPQVGGEIVSCLPSPDYSRIALCYVKSTALCPIHSIAIFDPERKVILGETSPQVGAPSAPWTWSPDSKWLTIPEEDVQLRMISRDGQIKIVPTKKVVEDIVWREDQPKKFLYTSSGPYVYEYDLSTRSERSIKTGFKYAEWLFTLNGKPCATGITKDGTTKSIKACLVDTGSTVLEITSPDNGDYSAIYSNELSPDGRFVALVCQEKTRELGIIARTRDLESVLGDRSKALYVEELCNPYFSVIWPINHADTTAIVDGRAIDLRDGCLRYSYEGVKRLAHWTPLTKNGRQIPCWLEVGRYGLCICADDQSLGKSPMLGHIAINGSN